MIKKVPIIDINTGKTIRDFSKFQDKNTLMVNKSDWSGEQIKITINRKSKTVKIHEPYNLILKFKRIKGLDEDDEGYQVLWKYEGDKSWNTLAFAFFYKGYWTVHSEELTREDKNMYVAAVQVACNII